MKLSEAILLGSTLRPQVIGYLTGQRPIDGQWGSCALGAAFEASKCPSKEFVAEVDYDTLRGARGKKGDIGKSIIVPPAWLKLLRTIVACPECGEASTLERIVAHLNDLHLWTRPAIAEWVKRFEPKSRKRAVENEQAAVAKVAEK